MKRILSLIVLTSVFLIENVSAFHSYRIMNQSGCCCNGKEKKRQNKKGGCCKSGCCGKREARHAHDEM